MGLKRFLKKAVKLGGKIAKPLLATTPVGQVALRAQTAFKSLGGNLKAARLGKIQPLSVRSTVEKIAAAGPAKRLRVPFPTRKAASRPRPISANGSKMPQNGKTANGKGKRVPPKGGLDLKRMAAEWRAAGKPGTWLGWIKSNPIKKAS